MANKFYDPSFIMAHKKAWNFLLGNRNAGKSFAYKKILLENYLKNKDTRKDCKFMLLFRKVDSVKLVAPFFFQDVLDLKYPKMKLEYKAVVNGFGRFTLNGEICGYACCIKNYQMLKPMAEVQTVEYILFDEFLTENNDYLKNEADMVRNIYSTVARGGGQFIREKVAMFFVSNTVSMQNPYFAEFPQIKSDFKYNTKRLVRDIFTLEIINNEEAVNAIMSTNFGKSLEGTDYGNYIMNNSFYNDNNKFIEHVDGIKNYVVTITMGGKDFAVYQSLAKGLFYVSQKIDPSYQKYVFDNDDHNINYIMISKRENFIKDLERMYKHDAVRFENLECKMMFLVLINIAK